MLREQFAYRSVTVPCGLLICDEEYDKVEMKCTGKAIIII